MVNYNLLQNLPSSEELPETDNTPVDSELHILVPFLLRAILSLLWSERDDWFFGVNMGIYHTTGNNPRVAIVPDGFLSLGVPRRVEPHGRLSYVVWEENNIVPIFVLEVVSKTYGREYASADETADNPTKMTEYARLGVLYYAIYNPLYYRRDKHQPFEVYRLVNGAYMRQLEEPVWMPEIGLGIGREIGICQGWRREWLHWYDSDGNRFPSPDEIGLLESQRAEAERQLAELEKQRAIQAEAQLDRERQRAETERQRADRLAELLRQNGIDPNSFRE